VGAAIPDKIELYVATAPIQLESTFPFAERRAAPARDEWTVRRQEGVPDRAQEREARLEAQGVEVIEEKSSDASSLLPVLQQEILVTLPLEAGIESASEGLDRRAGGLVPVDRVLAPFSASPVVKKRTFAWLVGT
jgi:hypothetical protein